MKTRTGVLNTLLSGVVLAGVALTSGAQAAPITYEGMLTRNVVEFGQVEPEPIPGVGTFGDWWFFNARAGDQITVTGRRLERALDPAFDLYFGFGDTDLLQFVDFGDDELEPLTIMGPFGDPQVTFTAIRSGTYSVHLWSFLSDNPGPDGVYDYLIFITPASVPEPAMLGLFGAGLLSVGMARRRRK